ncbi:MAG: flagellar biosynthesis protein FlhA, partial [Desulfatiglandales bacterium]
MESDGLLSLRRFQALIRQSDVLIAGGVVVILFFLILPIPPLLMDIALTFNMAISMVILLTCTYLKEPLELSSFPSIILITTLLRLGLNVASTRLILLRGDEGIQAAGKVIASFGGFVVGGNYAVGIVVFLILVSINLIVITRGAGRIAEVAARFTLDAMPGKQMSIDADLSSGLITEEEARARRQRISLEAEYYGAMDGASKFVRGDAVAGILIIFINIIGGLIIGVFQKGMELDQALSTFTILTIGDGLVSQIPSLIVSTSVGILVSKGGSSEANLGREIRQQVFSKPTPLAISAGVLIGLGFIPGLPTIPFWLLGSAAGLAAKGLREREKKELSQKEMEEAQRKKKREAPPLEAFRLLDPLSLEMGYGLVPLVEKGLEGTGLIERVKALRKQIAQEMGFLVPPVHIQDNLELRPNEYRILLKGSEVARGEIYPNYLLAMETSQVKAKMEGIPTKEPTYGLPGIWIRREERDKAIQLGYTVVDPTTVIITHLSHIIRSFGHELMGRQEVQGILDAVKGTHPKLVEELVPGILSL